MVALDAPLNVIVAPLPPVPVIVPEMEYVVVEATPVPVRLTTSVGVVGSLLVIVKLPDTAPAMVGLNVKLTGAFCPALIVAGVVIPLIPKSAPESVSTETVKLAVPAFDMVRVEVPVEPTETVPKLTAVELKLNCGCAAAAVAERLTVAGELPPSPCKVIVPVTVPALVGSTEIETVPACPTASAIGRVVPDRLNCELEKVACVRLTATVPLLVTERLCLVAFPTGTFPKVILVKLTRKEASGDVDLEAFTTPAHPLSRATGRIAARSRRAVSLFQFFRAARTLLDCVPAHASRVLAITCPSVVASSYEGISNGTRRPTGERANFGTVAGTVRRTTD